MFALLVILSLFVGIDVVHAADAHSRAPHRVVEQVAGATATSQGPLEPIASSASLAMLDAERPLTGIDGAPPDHPPRSAPSVT